MTAPIVCMRMECKNPKCKFTNQWQNVEIQKVSIVACQNCYKRYHLYKAREKGFLYTIPDTNPNTQEESYETCPT